MKKRLLALALSLVMVLAMIPAAFAADGYTAGIKIETASQENLTGPYGEAYSAAKYQATFTYEAGEDEDIAKIEVYGDFQWFTEDNAAQLAVSGYKARFHAISTYEYTDGLFFAGFGNPGGEGEYPEGVRYYKSYLHYPLKKVADGVYQLTMPLPAGLFRYQYRITDSEGNEKAIADPANDWNYTIEENNPNPATWSLVRLGSADEVSATEALVYPIEDETKQGRIEKTTVKTIIDTDQAVQVYLPYDYDPNDPVPYKTLYVSHGGSENERTWMTIGALPQIMDHLIAEGSLDHTIAVTMDNNVALNVFDVTILSDNFKDYLIPYIESHYNVSKSASDRAYFGTSWGGITGLYIMAEHPEMMSAYGLFSVGFAYDLTEMFKDTKEELKNHSIWLTVGNLESYAGPTVQSKYENLVELGLDDVTTYRKYNGAHEWDNWHAAAADFIRGLYWDDTTEITEAKAYTVTANAADGDVTALITTADGTPAFKDTEGIATAADGVVTIDASKITGINFNGTENLYLNGEKIARYVVPALKVEGTIYGDAYADARSNLKPYTTGRVIEYDEDSPVSLSLRMLPDLDDSLIDASGASVILDEGDGYYPAEYTFKGTALENPWVNGETAYNLKTGDIEINNYDYFIADPNSGRAWSCLGGDGQGNYWFNLTVSGITYNGLPVADQTFRAHIYIYGNNYTGDANKLYGEGTVVEAVKGESGVTANDDIQWTFIGENDIPVLCDYKADNIYVTWPVGTDASGITAEDVTITLRSQFGDTKALTANNFTVFADPGETQIAITYINWAFIPVYNTMTVSVNGAEKTFDIASVYVYEAQQGGGAQQGDGSVIVYSFYGLANQTDVFEIIAPATYTLSAEIDGAVKYYAEDENGSGKLVDTAAEAMVFDGSGPEDMNLRLIANSYYTTTCRGRTADKTVSGTTYTFSKNYSGGRMKPPTQADENLEALPGYIIPWGTSNWITNEKWAWQSSVKEGWTGITITPVTARFGWTVEQGSTQQFEASVEGVSWYIIGTTTSPDTKIDENGLLTVGWGESGVFDIVAYIPGDINLQASVHITAAAAPNRITASDDTVKAGETAEIAVTYSGAPASSVRAKLECDLPVISVESDLEYEYNPDTGAFVVYTAESFTNGTVLLNVKVDTEGAEPGDYEVKLTVIDATTASAEKAEVVAVNGTITVEAEFAKGDVNMDGQVDNADLVMLARYLVELEEFNERQMEIGDYDKDGDVDNSDLVLLARYLVGLDDIDDPGSLN